MKVFHQLNEGLNPAQREVFFVVIWKWNSPWRRRFWEAVGRFCRRESCSGCICTICPHIVSRDTDLFNSFLVRCVGVTPLEGIACQGIYVTDELSVVWLFKSSLGRMNVHTRK